MQHLLDPWFNAQFERTLGHASVGGADLGECYALTKRLLQRDFVVWYEAWYALGEKLERQAYQYALSGQHHSAHCAYLRASNYYRTSFFFLDEHPSDPRIETAYDLSGDTFKKSLANSDLNYETLWVPFEDTVLPGYLFLPKNTDTRCPLIIDAGGGDATKEELYFTTVVGSLQRGFACLIFDGPGQGAMLRKHKIPFRPDWEAVMTAVIDHVLMTHKIIDEQKIIVYGSSFGGYLAPRSATVEHRIAACIANPGVLNAMGSQASSFPEHIQKAIAEGDDATVNDFFTLLGQKDRMKGFLFASRTIRFGAATVAEMFKKTGQYELTHTAKDIQCPMIILDNEREPIKKGQAQSLFDAIAHEKKYYHCFTNQDGHGGHCQPLSHCHTNEVIFSYLQAFHINAVEPRFL